MLTVSMRQPSQNMENRKSGGTVVCAFHIRAMAFTHQVYYILDLYIVERYAKKCRRKGIEPQGSGRLDESRA